MNADIASLQEIEIINIEGRDKEIDAMAATLAKHIMKMPDKNDVEYVAVIYVDQSGQLKESGLHTSATHRGAPLSDAVQATPGYASVVAIVQNHPRRLVEDSPVQDVASQIERMPSDNDWNIARNQFKGRTDATHYILGPDDRLRKYPFAEMQHWEHQNDPQKFRRPQHRPRFGEEIDIPQALPADERAPGATPPGDAPEKASGSQQTQTGMLFDRLMDSAARGDADGMRAISQQ